MLLAKSVQNTQNTFLLTSDNFMLQEIREQPKVVQICLDTLLKKVWSSACQEQSPTHLNLSKKLYADLERIRIIGCGTSYHAGLVGKYWLEQLTGIPTDVQYASEHAYANSPLTPNTLTIAVSQSGESADTLQAVEIEKQRRCSQLPQFESRILAIANRPNSSLEYLADYSILTPAGEERAIAATKTFIAQVITFCTLALELAYRRQSLCDIHFKQIINTLKQLPLQIEIVLSTQEQYAQEIATFLAKSKHCIFLGRGINYPIALEGALKFKETTYIHAEGFAAGEFKHGPIALVDDGLPIVAIAMPGSPVFKKVLANAQQVKARGGYLIGVTPTGNPETVELFDYILPIPLVDELFSPLLSVIPLQLLAYYVAVRRGLDVDHPRHLTKAVTVE